MSASTKKRYTSKIYRELTGAKPSKEMLDLRRAQLEISSKIASALKTSPKTVPEIASESGLDSRMVLWYMMTYLKYGVVVSQEKTEEGYYKYALKPKA
jgi:predicted transcriptional regulator